MFKFNRPLALAGQALAATVLIVAAAAVQAQAAYPA